MANGKRGHKTPLNPFVKPAERLNRIDGRQPRELKANGVQKDPEDTHPGSRTGEDVASEEAEGCKG